MAGRRRSLLHRRVRSPVRQCQKSRVFSKSPDQDRKRATYSRHRGKSTGQCLTNPYHDDHESMAALDTAGWLCWRLPAACAAWRLLAACRCTGWFLGTHGRGRSVASGDRSDIAARHSMLLVWRWLEEMGRHGLRCRVIRASLHVCNGPLRASAARASVLRATQT